MSKKEPASPSRPMNDGYQPTENKGHQPIAIRPAGTSEVQGGHQPTTGQGPTGTPPNQGSGGQGGGSKK